VLKGWLGREVLLGQLHKGDCFGEMALMDLMPRSDSVRADTDCLALTMDSEDLFRLFEHDVEQFTLIQIDLGREASRRLRAVDRQLFTLLQGRAATASLGAGGTPLCRYVADLSTRWGYPAAHRFLGAANGDSPRSGARISLLIALWRQAMLVPTSGMGCRSINCS
jgi:CRP-like cAMP-binding protein